MFEHIIYKETVLANGLKVMTAQNSSIPVLDVEVWTRTGYRYEKPSELGYAHLLEHMLFGGTKRRPTKYDLSLQVESRGGYFNASTSQVSVAYDMQMMSSEAELMCDILSDMLLHSLLDPARLENEKKVVLQELKQAQENHNKYISRLVPKNMLPGHPMSQNILDTEDTTHNATSDRLREYLGHHYRPDQSAVVFAGDIDHGRAVALTEKYFGEWVAPHTPFDQGLVPMPRAEKNYYFEHRDIKQTFIDVSYYTHPRLDLRTSAAWSLITVALSGGSTSILNREIREKRGLVYGIGSGTWIDDDIGLFGIDTSTQNPREVLDLIDQVVSELPERLTPEVFERVRGQAIGNFTRYIVKPGNQSSNLGDDFISLNRIVSPQEWIDDLQAVSRQEALELVKKYLRPENSVATLLGPDDIGR